MKQLNKIPELKIGVIQAIIQRSVKLYTRVNDICNPYLNTLATREANRRLIDGYVGLAQSLCEEKGATKKFIRKVREMEAQRLAI